MAQDEKKKCEAAQKEEELLAFWDENNIFEKTLTKDAPKGEFVFYEGPPTANGHPGIHHVEARTFKDVIPRYKTMRGYHVRRKGGWDTHGLPVELQVEKELGLTSKKDIEKYGIAAFNEKCRESVWKYMDEWQRFTKRIGFWVDQDNPYITYEPDYMESVWNVIGEADKQGLLYKDYKVVPWCPRCGTGLSSHELAQGYQDVKDLSVTAKFKVKNEEDTYFLAWTTTPWTLPGNVGLAVGNGIDYVEVGIAETRETYILARDRLREVFGDDEYTITKEMKGKELIGLEYEPLYDFIARQEDIENLKNGWKVYEADFVTTEDGTGIVHTAVMYGQEDFELGQKVGLPKHHLVGEDGDFLKEAGFLSGTFVKDEETAVAIIKDLAKRDLLFKKEKYEHSYPHCWRCNTPLIYYARDSWYIRMSELRDTLVKENEKIHWEPAHIKEGRFGEWLREVKDWAISRERYWGTPLPVWVSEDGAEQIVIGSLSDLRKETKRNSYFMVRHGEADSNTQNIVSGKKENPHYLTENGRGQAKKAAEELQGKEIDLIIASPFIRTKETAEIVADTLGIEKKEIIFDERIKEIDTGDFNLKPVDEYRSFFSSVEEKFTKRPPHGETAHDVKQRVGEFLYDIDQKYKGKTILIVTHEYLVWMLESVRGGLTDSESAALKTVETDFIHTGEVRSLDFSSLPHNNNYELDLHRPYIDDVVLEKDGKEFRRVKEVMDVWLDSGAMPFAQDHYPMEGREWVDGPGYPADFISEAIDQTRGWFYTLHAVGVLMGKGRAYENVICLGHILDEKGKKMSKSIGNVVDPWEAMDTFGVDALRFWMVSVNQPGESKNFDTRTVDEVVKKVFNLLFNTTRFYTMYGKEDNAPRSDSANILDRWIVAKLHTLVKEVTENLDSYNLLRSSREIKEFIGELSTWYVRRSRDRFKDDNERADAVATLRYVLLTVAKLLAPFAPFAAERVFADVKTDDDPESVHLCEWPEGGKIDEQVLSDMESVRTVVSEALEKRAGAGIKVRQPLAKLILKESFVDEYNEMIKDELNVKSVEVNASQNEKVVLDTTLTDELRREGRARELIRNIQALRKKQKLTPDQQVILSVETNPEGKDLVAAFENDLRTVANVKEIRFEKITSGETLSDGETDYHVTLSS